MAKRKYSKRSKIEPAVLTLGFSLPDGVATSTIDLSQVASLVNRRFYRQGINWAVSGFKVISPGNALGSLSIAQLPNTWVMSNAWEKGMRTWLKMNREALEESESIRPRFLDFKIYADEDHHTAGYGNNLLPLDFAGAPAVAGEWESSKFVIPTSFTGSGATDFEVIAVGGNFPGAGASTLNAVSLIDGYAASRGLPNIRDPNTPADADDVGPAATPENWLASIFNEGTDQDKQVLDDMITENNTAPYPFENGPAVGGGVHADTMYPGGPNQLATLQYHDSAVISATTVGGVTTMKGGNFPCGLIRVSSTIDTAGTILQVNLVPGAHRGYMCEPMTEM